MKKLTISNLIVLSILMSAHFGGIYLNASSPHKSKGEKTEYLMKSYNLPASDDVNMPLMMHEIESLNIISFESEQKLTMIKEYILRANETPDLIQSESIKKPKELRLIDNPNLISVLEDPVTTIIIKQYSDNVNKIKKKTFEVNNPIMRLMEEYYLIDSSTLYYKSSTYYGIINIESDNVIIELFYPDYKKNISTPVFFQEIYKSIK
jgi:hypothetical protein